MEGQLKLLNAAELGAILGISRASVYKRRSLGDPLPPAVSLGSLVRWRPADVEAFLELSLESNSGKD